jgi:hypothetical protein
MSRLPGSDKATEQILWIQYLLLAYKDKKMTTQGKDAKTLTAKRVKLVDKDLGDCIRIVRTELDVSPDDAAFW